MTKPLGQTCGVRLPADSLAVLADLRRNPEIEVVLAEGLAWVRWEVGDDAVSRRFLAVPGVELFDLRDGLWYRLGCRLPAFGTPFDSDERWPLDRALTPLPVRPRMPDGPATIGMRLQLVRDDRPRAASALACSTIDLMGWADKAPSAWIVSLMVAMTGDRMLIRGKRLPTFPEGERYWGERILSPLGFQPEPMLSESALSLALGLGEDELAILESGGVEFVPLDAFRPLSRAAARMLAGGAAS